MSVSPCRRSESDPSLIGESGPVLTRTSPAIADFVTAGLTLFGPRWKAPLARTLGVSRETVSRWVSHDTVPKWAGTAVALLAAAKGSVLSLCDRTGNMVQPWAAAGFECFCVDTRHPGGEHRQDRITFVGADLRDWLPPARRYAIVFAFPPCTNLAGRRTLVQNQGRRRTDRGPRTGRGLPPHLRVERRAVDDRKPREHSCELLAQSGFRLSPA